MNECIFYYFCIYLTISNYEGKKQEPLLKWQPSRYFVLLASGHDITTTMKYEKLCLMYNIK